VPQGAGTNTFLGRWQSCDNIEQGTPKIRAQNGSVLLYPNPSNGVFQLEIKNYELRINNTLEVYNMLGEKVFTSALPPTTKGALRQINLTNQPNGIYLYRVITQTGNLVGEGKMIVQH